MAPQTGVRLVHIQREGVWPCSVRSYCDMSNYLGNFFLARKEKMIGGDDSYKMRCKPWGEFFSPRTHPDSVRRIHLKEQMPSPCPASLQSNPPQACLMTSWAFSAHTVIQATSSKRPSSNGDGATSLTRAHRPYQTWPVVERTCVEGAVPWGD